MTTHDVRPEVSHASANRCDLSVHLCRHLAATTSAAQPQRAQPEMGWLSRLGVELRVLRGQSARDAQFRLDTARLFILTSPAYASCIQPDVSSVALEDMPPFEEQTAAVSKHIGQAAHISLVAADCALKSDGVTAAMIPRPGTGKPVVTTANSEALATPAFSARHLR
jgi:hypothetical protein